jgi:NAD(P)-dependent dehydrogenase (short-subunit alcohol dehydrogenase family)
MMDSAHWDAALAERYLRFRYEFPERSLAGSVVIIAGGTGGLGAATVALLAREGAQVVVGYRSNRERAEALGMAIKEQFGRKLTLVEGDLADAGVRQTYLNAAELEGAPLAGAVIFPGDSARVSLEALDEDALEASLAANFVGPVLLARDLGETMERSKLGGSLVLLGTMQAVAAFPSSLNYAAPKAALVHSARVLAQHWNRVRVNVVAPGATVAGMAEASIRSGKYDQYIESGAIPRFGRPEDVARAVRFFLDPDGYATGQVLVVDGGLTLRRAR